MHKHTNEPLSEIWTKKMNFSWFWRVFILEMRVTSASGHALLKGIGLKRVSDLFVVSWTRKWQLFGNISFFLIIKIIVPIIDAILADFLYLQLFFYKCLKNWIIFKNFLISGPILQNWIQRGMNVKRGGQGIFVAR